MCEKRNRHFLVRLDERNINKIWISPEKWGKLGWMFACISMYHIMFEVHLFHGMVLKINSPKKLPKKSIPAGKYFKWMPLQCPKDPFRRISMDFPYNIFIYLFMYLFIYLCMYLFIDLFIYLCTYLFIYLCTYLFIYIY